MNTKPELRREFVPFLEKMIEGRFGPERAFYKKDMPLEQQLDETQDWLARFEVRRRWREAGYPQDLTQLCIDMGVDRENESVKPSPDLVVEVTH